MLLGVLELTTYTHTHNRTKHKTNEKQKQLVNILNTRYLIFKCDEF